MASIENIKEFSQPVLRGFVDESQQDNFEEFSFIESYMADETVWSRTYAYDILKRTQHIAAMIGVGAEKPVIDRHAAAKAMAEMADFGLQDVVTIEELMEIAEAQASGNSAREKDLVNKLLNRAADLLHALQLRKRVEKLKAVTLGHNSYNSNGVKVDLDYGIPEDQKVVLTGTDTWDNADKDVIGDILGYQTTYARNNGGKKPEAMLMTREVLNTLTQNTLFIAEAGRPEGVNRISIAEVQDVLSNYGLPALTVVEETHTFYKDIYTGEDVELELFPSNRVVFVSANAGKFLVGPNPDAENFEPVTILDAYDEKKPRRSIMEVSISGFAILDNPSLVMHVDVTEDAEAPTEPEA